jgi:3-oxoacyl-[acyl-carrier-protein] synthase-3
MSFLTALDVAAAFIMANRYRRLLLVTSDVASVGLNWEHPESSTLFGDLAVAAVVERTPNGEESCFQAVHFETYGDGANHTAIPGGGTLRHPNNPNTKPSDNLFHMNGAAVLQMAFEYLPPFLERVQPGLNKSILDIKWVVPHQASKVAINVFRSFNWPPEQIINILGWSGNCVAASLPGALYQGISDQRIRRGDPVLLLGFGAGLCFGAIKMIF